MSRGELIFRRKDLNCLTCHAIAGAGGAVGPDLTSIGASAQVDYLVESLLQPNKAIKEGYHSLVVTTKKARPGGAQWTFNAAAAIEITDDSAHSSIFPVY